MLYSQGDGGEGIQYPPPPPPTHTHTPRFFLKMDKEIVRAHYGIPHYCVNKNNKESSLYLISIICRLLLLFRHASEPSVDCATLLGRVNTKCQYLSNKIMSLYYHMIGLRYSSFDRKYCPLCDAL
jgi:hypothetical protein